MPALTPPLQDQSLPRPPGAARETECGENKVGAGFRVGECGSISGSQRGDREIHHMGDRIRTGAISPREERSERLPQDSGGGPAWN